MLVNLHTGEDKFRGLTTMTDNMKPWEKIHFLPLRT